MGAAGPWGAGADRGGRHAITRRGGWGGYGGLGPGDDAAGLGDMGGFGGLGRDDDEPPIDAQREPGRAQHLATGEGGTGDWTDSAAGMGQRRGPADPDRPFGADRGATARVRRDGRHARDDRPSTDRFGGEHYGDERDDDRRAPGRSYVGWADAGSMQGRWSGEGPRGDDTHGAPPSGSARRPGPKGWQRSDERIHDDVCERLSRSGLDASDVSVEVRDGRVTLAGTVSDRPMKHAIESLVDGCHGVRDIDNRIKVMRPEPRQDDPPRPRASVPQDSPTARDEARGRTTRLPRDGSGYFG
jgi:hypothetical protein